MTDLSPTARAVLDAFVGDPTERDELEDDRRYLAAALRAAVQELKYFGITEKNILAIATELENANA